MKQNLINTSGLGFLAVTCLILSAWYAPQGPPANGLSHHLETGDSLQQAAFLILDTKCNVCHRKQNPFMVFNLKNMKRRATKIYDLVFVQQRMPKGDATRLTTEERATLKQWLSTQNI